MPQRGDHVGWVESSPYSRFYAIDLQRGNLVVRNTMSTWAGVVSEEQFRTYAEQLARQLAAVAVE